MSGKRALWIFVTTIGELNAIEPFIKALRRALGSPPLTLITNHPHYTAAYLAKYPDARVEVIQGSSNEASKLARRSPPGMLLVAEIPCLLHDAPCRFSFATLMAAKSAGASTVLVNGWLYGYAPPSRMDRVENALFGIDYVRGFDLMMVQTAEIRARLLEAGASADRVLVAGNIKFDCMASSPVTGPATALADAIATRKAGPVIVVGSVSEPSEQQALLAGFRTVLRQHEFALLILAPRHPEDIERMSKLAKLLEDSCLRYRFRSKHAPEDAVAASVLILDTMGELRSCYAAATIAFVGTDHNVLEPMAFGKPVFVSGQWERTYPSFPVYCLLREAGALHYVDDLASIGDAWLTLINASASESIRTMQHAMHVLEDARGAVERCLSAFDERGLLADKFGI